MKVFGVVIFICFVFQLEALKFDDIKAGILPTPEECGYSNDVVPDTQSDEFQFSWMAFLPLETRTFSPGANVRCAGTLISKRYVLLAKSCLQFHLGKVHLGYNNASLDYACSGDECPTVLKAAVEDVAIDEKLEVVLLRLGEDVEFTDNIKPICLPFEDFPRAETGATVYSSGWGLTAVGEGFSVTKKIVKETLISNQECKKGSDVQGDVDDQLICVQVQAGSEDVPCNGDEGSPVMYHSGTRWVLEGVLNWVFGSRDEPCAIDKPARGIRITEEVLEWIVAMVEKRP